MPDSNNELEEAAFLRELTKNQAPIGAFLRTMLPAHADVDSLLQEVSVTLWQKKSSFEAGTNFRAWAFQIAKFCALNERRKMKNQIGFITLDDSVLEFLSANVEYDDEAIREKRAALEVCLEKLKPKERELVEFRYTTGLSIEQYSKQNRQNSGTLRAILRRVRTKLRNCINTRITENEV